MGRCLVSATNAQTAIANEANAANRRCVRLEGTGGKTGWATVGPQTGAVLSGTAADERCQIPVTCTSMSSPVTSIGWLGVGGAAANAPIACAASGFVETSPCGAPPSTSPTESGAAQGYEGARGAEGPGVRGVPAGLD